MCEACHAERHEDPHNRRFHAQPNACWECGPQLELWDVLCRPVAAQVPLGVAVEHLRAGKIVAVKDSGDFTSLSMP